MSNRHKKHFKIKFNGRTGHFWQACKQAYSNCEFTAGLIKGLEPDTIYMRIDGDGRKPSTIFLRPDEATAILYVLSGALWSSNIMTRRKTE